MNLIADPELAGMFFNEDIETDDKSLCPIWRAEFIVGVVELYFDHVAIYSGPIFNPNKNRIDVPLSQITSIELTRGGGILSQGILRFHVPGYSDVDSGLIVSFTRDQQGNELAEAVRDSIIDSAHQYEEYISGFAFGGELAPVAEFSVADEIAKLKSLLDQGALSQAEFEQAKRSTLQRLP